MRDPWLLMTYDQGAKRWVVDLDGEKSPIYCGECLEVRIFENKAITCRLELDRDWYVIAKEARFDLRTRDSYQVHI